MAEAPWYPPQHLAGAVPCRTVYQGFAECTRKSTQSAKNEKARLLLPEHVIDLSQKTHLYQCLIEVQDPDPHACRTPHLTSAAKASAKRPFRVYEIHYLTTALWL